MRIVINGWFADQLATGSGQYLSALLQWLPRAGSDHEFLLVQPRGARAEAQAEGPSGGAWRSMTAATPFDRSSDKLAKLWFEQVAFPRVCRQLAADVAFVPYWGSPWWQPCPVVVTVHDLIPLLLPAYRGGALQRAYTWLVGKTARRAAAVLTDSEASRKDIVRYLRIPAERVHAVHLAASPHFGPAASPEERTRVRATYNLPEGPFVLYLGGFDARKNVGRLLEAFAGTLSRWEQEERNTGRAAPWLVIAGRLPAQDTPSALDPRPLAARLGIASRVHFTGWVDEKDKPALYALAQVTVFASEYEGFGLPVLEAMATGA